jgi:hypothetical protein
MRNQTWKRTYKGCEGRATLGPISNHPQPQPGLRGRLERNKNLVLIAREPEIPRLKARYIIAWVGASRRAQAQVKRPRIRKRCKRGITVLDCGGKLSAPRRFREQMTNSTPRLDLARPYMHLQSQRDCILQPKVAPTSEVLLTKEGEAASYLGSTSANPTNPKRGCARFQPRAKPFNDQLPPPRSGFVQPCAPANVRKRASLSSYVRSNHFKMGSLAGWGTV